jgi:integrase/recombinase XerD
MSRTVSTVMGDAAMPAMHSRFDPQEATALYTRSGARKYLNEAERKAVLAAIDTLEPDARLFALTLFWTGARISEVLALRGHSFQPDAGVVAVKTLKRRRLSIREIPLPPPLLAALNGRYALARLGEAFLWPWSRTTGWRVVRGVMQLAGVVGAAACPRGMRHGFALATLRHGVPLTLLSKWLGHARLATTAIYAAVCGADEIDFAGRVWRAAA